MILRAAFFLLTLLAAAGVSAAPSRLCEEAAERAARSYGIPPTLMRAIALVESGRTQEGQSAPWPWTLNIEGKGFWFASRSEALDHARVAIARGARSIDLGCFQINRRWHGHAFETLDAMLDPVAGADYAARFLRQLYLETGHWLTAAGFYHSRTADVARRYRARIAGELARIDSPVFNPGVEANAIVAASPSQGEIRHLPTASIRTAASLHTLPDPSPGGLLSGASMPLFGRASGPLFGPRS